MLANQSTHSTLASFLFFTLLELGISRDINSLEFRFKRAYFSDSLFTRVIGTRQSYGKYVGTKASCRANLRYTRIDRSLSRNMLPSIANDSWRYFSRV